MFSSRKFFWEKGCLMRSTMQSHGTLSPLLVHFRKEINFAAETLLPLAFECASIGFANVIRETRSVVFLTPQ